MSDNNVQKMRFAPGLNIISSANCKVSISNGPGAAGAGKVATQESQDEEMWKAKCQTSYQDGRKAGRQEMTAEIDALRLQAQAVARDIPQSISEYFTELEMQMREEICKLSFSIAETLVMRELESKDIVRELIHNALTPLMSLENVKIRLNPGIVNMMSSEEVNPTVPQGVDVSPDPKLGPGDVIVETPNGLIDGTLAGRMELIKDEIHKALAESLVQAQQGV